MSENRFKGRGNRRTGGNQRRKTFGNTSIADHVRVGVDLALKNFRVDENEVEFEFPSSFTNTERAYIHKIAASMGLKSKSRGNGQSRYITVYKVDKSTIVNSETFIDVCQASHDAISNLLNAYPVSGKERVGLLPVNERSSSVHAREFAPLARPGDHLTNGSPQIAAKMGGKSFLSRRQELPIWNYRNHIMETINKNQIVLLTGDTGSGKTTQVPQFILEDSFKFMNPVRLVVCEPRRLAAVTVSTRVAEEREEKLGQLVGYKIRLNSCTSPNTILTFCTYGVLLRSLMSGGPQVAQSFTHIIVDEIHERDKLSDFLLTVLKDILEKNKSLKLILMSATVDVQQFLNFFPGCVQVSVPGRMFPVEEVYLEDVLSVTSYTTPAMEKNRKMVSQTPAAELSSDFLSKFTQQSIQDTSDYQESSDNSAQPDDADDQAGATLVNDADMDRLIAQCFREGNADCFLELRSRLEEDFAPILDYQHSGTGVTPLMVAASCGDLELLQLLLELGANASLPAKNGWTALDLAKQANQEESVKMLEDYAVFVATKRVPSEAKSGSTKSRTGLDTGQTNDEKLRNLALYQCSFDDDQVDIDLIFALIQHIFREKCGKGASSYVKNLEGDGAILVFLPGYEDIVTLKDLIEECKTWDRQGGKGVSLNPLVLILHSQMAAADHKRAFEPTPAGRRKVILATNVAETGITLPDVTIVIDSGKVKEKSFDALTNVTTLSADWISKSSARQRQGRAGRCRPGVVFRLYSSLRYAHMSEFQTPEIQRTPILDLCLQTKLLAGPNTPVADFLARVPDPPAPIITRNAVQALKTIEALDYWEQLTPLGYYLLDLPLDPVLAKVVLMAAVLQCLDPVLTVVAMLSYRDPFQIANNSKKEANKNNLRKRLAEGLYSDHLAFLRLLKEWNSVKKSGRNAEQAWCRNNLVSGSHLEVVMGIKDQVLSALKTSGFLGQLAGQIDLNVNSECWPIVKACLAAGLYPNVGQRDNLPDDDVKVIHYRTGREPKVRIHPSSCLASFNKKTKTKEEKIPTDWVVYSEMNRIGRTAYMRCVSAVSPLTVMLFCGPTRLPAAVWEISNHTNQSNALLEETSDSEEEPYDPNESSVVNLDSWIALRCLPRVAQPLLQMRAKWTSLWARRMAAYPGTYRPTNGEEDAAIIEAVVQAVAYEDASLKLFSSDLPENMNSRFGRSISDGGESSDGFTGIADRLVASLMNPQIPTKFFIVRPSPGSMTALMNAMSNPGGGVWSFPPATERKLQAEANQGYRVIIIFHVNGSQKFQGSAVFTGQRRSEGNRVGQRLEWISRCPVAMSEAGTAIAHLVPPPNSEDRMVAQDAVELDRKAAQTLLKVLVSVVEQSGSGADSGGRGLAPMQRNNNNARFKRGQPYKPQFYPA